MKYCIWLLKHWNGKASDELYDVAYVFKDINAAYRNLCIHVALNKELGYKREFEVREYNG